MDRPEFDDDSSLGESSPDGFFIQAVGFEGGLAVVAIVLGLIFGPRANQMVPEHTDWQSILWGLGLGSLCALPMVGVCRWLQALNLKAVDEINEFVQDHLLPLMKQLTVAELAIISLCAGVGEELLFRGWLQMLMTGSESEWTTTSLAVGIGVASLAFGLAHAVSRLYVLIVFFMGIVFGVLLVVTGNLLVPIAAHALFDFIQLILAIRDDNLHSATDGDPA